MGHFRLQDITFEQNTINVTGKVGERQLPISQATRKALLSYLRVRNVILGEDAFFTTDDGNALTKTALHSVFQYLAKKANLKCRFYPYLMRHTAATAYLQEGAGLETVRMLLGHSSLSVTQRYLSLTHTDLVKAQRNSSPVNRLR